MGENMNLLIVDDLQAIAESLKNGIEWSKVGISNVLTANSAAEAKLLITNFEIDILLTDIEMPGESGLELAEWIRDKNYDICTIFITSHEEFAYVQTALRIGGYDYILQPVRYSNVESTVSRAVMEVRKNKKRGQIEQAWNQLYDRRSIFLDAFLSQLRVQDYNAADVIMEQLLAVLEISRTQAIIHGVKVDTDALLTLSHSIIEDIAMKLVQLQEACFDGDKIKVCISHSVTGGFYLLLAENKDYFDEDKFKQTIYHFMNKINAALKLNCVLYVSTCIENISQSDMNSLAETFFKTRNTCEKQCCQVIWDTEPEDNSEYKNAILDKAVNYIQTHIGKNITRAEVAAHVSLNEEYFSKFFKQYYGCNFKEYVIDEKIKVAKGILINSNLPVSLIAAKLGFINFSHFSKTFKKNTELSPQDFRKLYHNTDGT